MSAQDYIAIAAVCRKAKSREQLIMLLARLFAEKNPKFDSVKFLETAKL